MLRAIKQGIIEIKPTDRKLRDFGISLAILSCLAAGFLFWAKEDYWFVWLVIGAAFLAVALVKPQGLTWIYYAWSVVGVVLGTVVARIILALFYLIVVTPVGLLFRLFGQGSLSAGFDRKKESYWENAAAPADKTAWKKQY